MMKEGRKTMKRGIGVIVAVVCIAFLLSGTDCFGEELNAEKVLAMALKAEEQLADMSYDILVKAHFNEREMTQKGTVWYKSKDKYKVESTVTFSSESERDPIKAITILDGGILWKIIKDSAGTLRRIDRIDTTESNEAVKHFIRPRIGIPPNVDFMAKHFDLKYTGTEELDGQKVYVLKGTRKEEAQGETAFRRIAPDSIRICISQSSGLPVKIELGEASGKNGASASFTNVKTGVEMKESLFSYAPPEGAPIFYTNNILKAMIESLEDDDDTEQEDTK
jgi:outer membrane lipoprotein-sorting protein